jgi:hypothetical protein
MIRRILLAATADLAFAAPAFAQDARPAITVAVQDEGQAFERRADVTMPSGAPIVVATHGNAPGDDAVAFLAGGGMPQSLAPRASLRDLAPAILHLLGLPPLPGTEPTLLPRRVFA